MSTLFNKSTDRGRALRTLVQGLGSVLVHLPFILLIPEVREFVGQFPPVFGITLAAVAAIIAYIQNKKGL